MFVLRYYVLPCGSQAWSIAVTLVPWRPIAHTPCQWGPRMTGHQSLWVQAACHRDNPPIVEFCVQISYDHFVFSQTVLFWDGSWVWAPINCLWCSPNQMWLLLYFDIVALVSCAWYGAQQHVATLVRMLHLCQGVKSHDVPMTRL